MRIGKGNQEEDDYGEEDFSSKREGPSSHTSNTTAASRDAKENDKASAIRSKHSVTEQRRRSKINERFQILREIIPNSEQKRDTASFLLEVIDYVQYLQEKVQKYEGSSFSGWSQEPTKLTPWRNNHWRVQSLANHPVAVSNGSVPVIPFPGKFEENSLVSSAPATVAEMQNSVESDKGRAAVFKPIDSQVEFDDNKELPPVNPFVHGELVNNEGPATSDGAGQSNNDLVIEGGTISISTAYSHELLSSLTQALQNAGVDLSHANLSVQIDLGKRANQGVTQNDPSNKNPLQSDTEDATRSRSVEGESEHTHKRMKTL